MKRLRWADGRLHCGAKSRPCTEQELLDLYTQLDAQLGRDWSRADMQAVGDALSSWLGDFGLKKGCRLEVAGHSALVHLPWELLRHDGKYLAEKRPPFEPVRRVDDALGDTAPEAPGKHSMAVLFMAAAPEGQHPLAYEEEERRIEDALASQDGLMLDLVVGGSVDALNDKLALLDDWAVVHLTAHGAHNPPRLALEDAFARTALVEPDDLDLHPGGQRLLVVSACASGQAETATTASLAYALAEAEVAPCIVGFGAKVGDIDATQMAALLYHDLNQGKTVSRALADTRRTLIKDGVDDPRAWAALRQFVTATGGGALALPKSRRVQRQLATRRQPMHAARVGAGHLPTAPTGRFVGRRKCLRQIVNALGPNECGALLTGLGGVGKSTLAAQALRRFTPHIAVELFRDFSPSALFHALRTALPADAKAQAALSDEALQQALNPQTGALRLSLAQAIRCDTAAAHPLIFVFDDLEAAMQTDSAGEYLLRDGWPILKDEPARVLAALLAAVAETSHRVLLTSRYPTRVDDARGVDLLARLTRIEVARPGAAEQVRMIRQANRWDDNGRPRPDGYAGLDVVQQARAAKVAGHNPRLLNRVHAAVAGGADTLLDELDAYLTGDGDVPDALLATFNNLVIKQLIALAGPGVALLNGLTAFPVPVPIEAACAGLQCAVAEVEKLIDLTLVERLPDGLIGLPAMVRPDVVACDDESAGLMYGPFLDALPADWQPTDDKDWNGPAARAQFVFEAALAAIPIRDALAGAAGGRWVRFLNASSRAKDARALTDVVDALTPNPWLLSRLAEAWWSSDTQRSAALMLRARGALPANPPSELAIYILLRQVKLDVRKGAPDDALAHLREAQPLAESDKTRAVILGEIARILRRKGNLDEALTLHREEMAAYEALEDRRSCAAALCDIAHILADKGEVDEALILRREALAVLEAVKDKRSRAVVLGGIAEILQHKGEVDEAVELYFEILDVFEALGDRRSRAVTLGYIGHIFNTKGKVDQALDLHRERLAEFEALEDQRESALAIGDIARILAFKGEDDEALVLQRKKLAVCEALGEQSERAITQGDIACLLDARGKVDEALALHHEKLALCEALGFRRSRAVALGDIANILAKQQHFDEAKRLQVERLRENEALEDAYGIGSTYLDLGYLMIRMGDPIDVVVSFFGQSFEAFRQTGNVEFIASSGLMYGQCLFRLGRFREARVPLEASRDAYQVLRNDELFTQVEALLASISPES